MRKVYTDPALKDNKKWTIYTTHELYKHYKVKSALTDYGIMELANEALTIYMEIMPVIDVLKNEAEQRGLELTEYIKEILEKRNST